jgi:hypothetical protein
VFLNKILFVNSQSWLFEISKRRRKNFKCGFHKLVFKMAAKMYQKLSGVHLNFWSKLALKSRL